MGMKMMMNEKEDDFVFEHLSIMHWRLALQAFTGRLSHDSR